MKATHYIKYCHIDKVVNFEKAVIELLTEEQFILLRLALENQLKYYQQREMYEKYSEINKILDSIKNFKLIQE